jgi:hypothetical protein
MRSGLHERLDMGKEVTFEPSDAVLGIVTLPSLVTVRALPPHPEVLFRELPRVVFHEV